MMSSVAACQIDHFQVFHNTSVITYTFALKHRPTGTVTYRLEIVGLGRILDHGVLKQLSETQTVAIPQGIDPHSQYLLTVTRNKVSVSRSTVAVNDDPSTTTPTPTTTSIKSVPNVKTGLGVFKFTDANETEATLQFNVPDGTDCWSLHLLLDQNFFPKIPSGAGIDLYATNVKNSLIKTNGGPWLTDTTQLTNNVEIGGYSACRFPNRPYDSNDPNTDQLWVTGDWTATLHSDNIFPFTDLTKIQVWLCYRTMQSYTQSLIPKRRLGIKFILVASKALYKAALDMTLAAIPQMIERYSTGLNVEVVPAPSKDSALLWIHPAADNNYTVDWYALQALTSQYQENNDVDRQRVHVFIFTNLTIQGGAVGLSMKPGPQGFYCIQAGPVIRIKPDSILENSSLVGNRIAHEVGHYLGLTHYSACLGLKDNVTKPTDQNFQYCTTAIRDTEGTGPYASYVISNMMRTGNPGTTFERAQVEMVHKAPLVSLEVIDNSTLTRITTARIWVVTALWGWKFHLGETIVDGPGTEDDVYFALRFKRSSGEEYIIETLLDNAWQVDLRLGTFRWYEIDVSSREAYVEEVIGFSFRKVSRWYRIWSDDAWYLNQLKIYINEVEWMGYDQDPNVWITNNGTASDTYAEPLSRPSIQIRSREIQDPVLTSWTAPFLPNPTLLSFGGQDSQKCYIKVPNWVEVEATGPQITLQAWIYISSTGSPMTVMSAGTSTNRLFLGVNNGVYQVGIISGGSTYTASMTAPTTDLNKWIHLCGTYDGSQWSIYRNGLVGNQTSGPSLISQVAGDLTFGVSINQNDYLQGGIRNICIWKVARTVSQIQVDLYRTDFYDSNVAGYWSISDGYGQIADDSSLGGNDGNIQNPNWIQPRYAGGTCLYCTGSSGTSYGKIPANSKMFSFTGDLTIAAWVKIGASDLGSMTGETCIAGSSQCGLRLIGNQYNFGIYEGQGVSISLEQGDLGYWVHLCGQYSSAQRSWILYKNGFEVATQSGTGYGATLSTDWCIGGRPGISSAAYSLQVRMIWTFTTPISQTNLQSSYIIYESSNPLPSTSKADGLVFFWPCDAGVGELVPDMSQVEPDADATVDESFISWGQNPKYVNLFISGGASIQSAITAITDASVSKQYVIYLSPGVFNNDTSINLKPWVAIVGAGMYLTDLNLLDTALKMADGSQVRQLGVYCKPGTTSTLIGLSIQGVSRALVDSVYVYLDAGKSSKPTLQCITSVNCQALQIANSQFDINTIAGGSQGTGTSFSGGSVYILNSTLNSDTSPTISVINNNTTLITGCNINPLGRSATAISTDTTSYVTYTTSQIKGACIGNVTSK